MPSAYNILEDASEISYRLEFEEMEDDIRVAFETELSDLYLQMEEKVENTDAYVLHMQEQDAVITAKIKVQQDEIKRLRAKKNGIERTKNYFFQNILPRTINQFGDGKEYKTDISTYKFTKKYSKLIVEDFAVINKKYIKQPDPVIDGVKARSAAIKAHQAGTKEDGFHVYEEQIVRRT